MNPSGVFTEASKTHGANINRLPPIDWNVKLYGVHWQKVKPDWFMPMESHIGFEILLILEGCQETVMGQSRYILKQGDIMLISPGFKHENRCLSPEGMTYFTAHFNVDDPLFREEMTLNNRVLFPAGTPDNAKLRSILEDWMVRSTPGGMYSTAERFRFQAGLFELLSLLSQIASDDNAASAGNSPTSVQYAKAIAEAIKQSIKVPSHSGSGSRENVKIEDIAAALGISSGYGLEVFRKVYGMSPRKYMSELKLNEAKVLIAQADLSLQEVAERLGYSHLSHFSRQFKRWTGRSPLQYRQKTPPKT